MSIKDKDSNLRSNIKQDSLVESLSEDAPAAIERHIVLKEMENNNDGNKEQKGIKSQNDAEDEEKNENLSKRIDVGKTQDKSLSVDELELNISSQLSQVDFEVGEDNQKLQKQVN